MGSDTRFESKDIYLYPKRVYAFSSSPVISVLLTHSIQVVCISRFLGGHTMSRYNLSYLYLQVWFLSIAIILEWLVKRSLVPDLNNLNKQVHGSPTWRQRNSAVLPMRWEVQPGRCQPELYCHISTEVESMTEVWNLGILS